MQLLLLCEMLHFVCLDGFQSKYFEKKKKVLLLFFPISFLNLVVIDMGELLAYGYETKNQQLSRD